MNIRTAKTVVGITLFILTVVGLIGGLLAWAVITDNRHQAAYKLHQERLAAYCAPYQMVSTFKVDDDENVVCQVSAGEYVWRPAR